MLLKTEKDASNARGSDFECWECSSPNVLPIMNPSIDCDNFNCWQSNPFHLPQCIPVRNATNTPNLPQEHGLSRIQLSLSIQSLLSKPEHILPPYLLQTPSRSSEFVCLEVIRDLLAYHCFRGNGALPGRMWKSRRTQSLPRTPARFNGAAPVRMRKWMHMLIAV